MSLRNNDDRTSNINDEKNLLTREKLGRKDYARVQQVLHYKKIIEGVT